MYPLEMLVLKGIGSYPPDWVCDAGPTKHYR